MARQGPYLNLVKGTGIAGCLDDSDSADVLRREVILQALRIIAIREGTDLQVRELRYPVFRLTVLRRRSSR